MKTVIPQFYEKDENGEPIKTASGAKRIRRNINSKPLSMDNYKVDLGGILLGKKTYAREVADEEDNSSPTYSSESGMEMQSNKGTGMSNYSSDIQAGIKAFMKANNYSEGQAIKILKDNKKIKN
jgi:hypothetical protein